MNIGCTTDSGYRTGHGMARLLVNTFWPPLGANQDGRPVWGTGCILAVEQRTVGLSRS